MYTYEFFRDSDAFKYSVEHAVLHTIILNNRVETQTHWYFPYLH